MNATREWDVWAGHWRTVQMSPAQLDAMIERTRRTRRTLWVVRTIAAAVPMIALTIVGLALEHAANAFEAGLGLVVALGIVTVWFGDVDSRRDAAARVATPADAHLAARRALCVRQVQLGQLGWIVVVLDLAFLIPWWIGGFAVHGSGFHVEQILTIWTPLALMAGFVTWTIVIRRRAEAELRWIVDQERA